MEYITVTCKLSNFNKEIGRFELLFNGEKRIIDQNHFHFTSPIEYGNVLHSVNKALSSLQLKDLESIIIK